MKKTLRIICAGIILLTLGAANAYAQTVPPIIPVGTNTQQKPGEIPISTLVLPGAGIDNSKPAALWENVLPAITNTVITLTGGLSLLFTIISGIQVLTAYGSEEKIGAAKKTLTWALLGLLISILSYAIVQIIISINLGVPVPATTPTPPPATPAP